MRTYPDSPASHTPSLDQARPPLTLNASRKNPSASPEEYPHRPASIAKPVTRNQQVSFPPKP